MEAFNLPPAADGNFLERRSGLSNLSRGAAIAEVCQSGDRKIEVVGDLVRGEIGCF